MEKERINVAEILRHCLAGMNLDCVCFENVVFDRVDDKNRIRCFVGSQRDEVSFNEYGCLNGSPSAKCVIFPKGGTWENLSLKFSYKDGDILYLKSKNNFDWVFIYKHTRDDSICRYASMNDYDFYHNPDRPLISIIDFKELRFATEEEKRKLFDVIRANGYRWNPETKTLEKLIVPKYKVGDVIQDKDSYKVKITDVNVEDEMYGYESVIVNGIGGIGFDRQDEWELVPDKFDVTTLKPFDKVLVRLNSDCEWYCTSFSHISKDDSTFCYKYVTTAGKSYSMMIPYEGNEHLRGKIDNCADYYKNWE